VADGRHLENQKIVISQKPILPKLGVLMHLAFQILRGGKKANFN